MFRKLIILLIIAFTSVNGQNPNIPNCVIDREKDGLKVIECIGNRITDLSQEDLSQKTLCCPAVIGYECLSNVLKEKCRDQMDDIKFLDDTKKTYYALAEKFAGNAFAGNYCVNFDENQCNFSIGLVPSIMLLLSSIFIFVFY
jgi:hypothetical protein